MAQYTSTATDANGKTFNAVLDTVTSLITYTITNASGSVVASASVNSGTPPNFPSQTLNDVINNVANQAAEGEAISTATGNPPPAESQAIPVPPASNPETVAPTATETVDNSAPQDTTDPASANAVNGSDLASDQVQAQKTLPDSSPTGPAYDDGDPPNLMPGWSLNENNDPVWVGNNPDGTVFVEPATKASADASFSAFKALSAKKLNTNSQATQQDVANFQQKEDWRVRLSLAPSANYLYKNQGKEGILKPLAYTDGVIFPYTPSISVNYNASYDNSELTHSNYKMFQYRSSAVDNIQIGCDFTAQDTSEANYLLAVIHFFRSVTKMFYGQDQNPKNGTPPPLVYLSGLGAFQFDAHPLAITGFNYTLPTDVDYIRAGSIAEPAGVNKSPAGDKVNSSSLLGSLGRLFGSGLSGGALKAPPTWQNVPNGTVEPTYVPTKMNIQISAIPIVTRNDISNKFSLEKYGTGELLRGTKRQGGGIW